MPSVSVARQPIFDSTLKVVAYELLYRSGPADLAFVRDPVEATAQVLSTATLDIGFARLAGSLPAFIKFPSHLLASPLKLPLAPERIVIEVVDGAAPAAGLMNGLSWLRSEGYKVALDDFDVRKDNLELLDYADVVKVDVRRHTPAALAESVRELRRSRLQLVAEKIETPDELAHCRGLGFDLFQGYFLQHPQTFVERRAPNSRMSVLNLILSLEECRVSADQIEKCIARDVGLSYRLLRCINSSYYRVPRQVRSIRQAILLIGYEELRRICAVLLLTSLGDRPSYLTTQALVRARMCEGLCQRAGGPACDGHFLAGLLSLVDVFLGAPIDECLEDLPLSDSVRQALLHQQGPVGAALRCVLGHERGDWDGAGFGDLSARDIGSVYEEAVGWADQLRVELDGAR